MTTHRNDAINIFSKQSKIAARAARSFVVFAVSALSRGITPEDSAFQRCPAKTATTMVPCSSPPRMVDRKPLL
ncbi:hypothetical protein MTP99_006390 [Tenebrio molitor]|nr:hypothetical protein MTP99_006390 [Tenebrio molitor]